MILLMGQERSFDLLQLPAQVGASAACCEACCLGAFLVALHSDARRF